MPHLFPKCVVWINYWLQKSRCKIKIMREQEMNIQIHRTTATEDERSALCFITTKREKGIFPFPVLSTTK